MVPGGHKVARKDQMTCLQACSKNCIIGEWEEELYFTTVKESCMCFICRATVAMTKRHNVEQHLTTCHESYYANYPLESTLQPYLKRFFLLLC